MFASQTEIVQLLLLCCIVIQSCLLHEVGSSLTPLKAESEPPSEGATTDNGNDDGDDYGTENIRRIENNRPYECRSRCRSRCRRHEMSSKKSKVPKALQHFPSFVRLLKRRSVESYDQKQDYVPGNISRAILDWNLPLAKVTNQVLNDVNFLIFDAKDYFKLALSSSPSVEMSVEFNCKSFWECIKVRTLSLTAELIISPWQPLHLKFRGWIGLPYWRVARSATFDNDDSARRPVYVGVENIIRKLIKLNDTINDPMNPVNIDTGYSKVSSAKITRMKRI